MIPTDALCGFTSSSSNQGIALNAIIEEASTIAKAVTAAHDKALFDIPVIVLPLCEMENMWGGLGYCRIARKEQTAIAE